MGLEGLKEVSEGLKGLGAVLEGLKLNGLGLVWRVWRGLEEGFRGIWRDFRGFWWKGLDGVFMEGFGQRSLMEGFSRILEGLKGLEGFKRVFVGGFDNVSV